MWAIREEKRIGERERETEESVIEIAFRMLCLRSDLYLRDLLCCTYFALLATSCFTYNVDGRDCQT